MYADGDIEMREINLYTIKQLRLSNVQTSCRVVCMQARALTRDAFFSLVPVSNLLSLYIFEQDQNISWNI